MNFVPGADLEIINAKSKRLEMKNSLAKNQDTSDVMYDRGITILSKNGLPIPVELTVIYRIKPELASDIYVKYGPDITWDNKLVVPQVRDVAREVMGSADIYELNKQRDKYSKLIIQKLNMKIGKYIVIENVMIKNIGIPQKIKESIEQKMQMKENAEKAKYEVEKAKQEAEKKIAIAKGEAEKIKIAADAKAYQITAEAKAQAKANEILSKSVTKELVQYQWVQRWNGVVPRVQTGGNDSLLIQP